MEDARRDRGRKSIRDQPKEQARALVSYVAGGSLSFFISGKGNGESNTRASSLRRAVRLVNAEGLRLARIGYGETKGTIVARRRRAAG